MSWTTGTQAETLGSSIAVGSAYASSATATSVTPATGAGYTPANFYLLPYGVGKRLWIKAYGVLSTTSTPNLTFGISANSTQGTYNSSNIMATTGAVAQASGVTNVPWDLECMVTCATTGASGTFLAMGEVRIYTASTTIQSIRLSSSSANPNTAATLSTENAYYWEMFATWGTSSASNSLTVYDYSVYGVN